MIKTATKIVEKLQHEGFEAYFAGGYVRDLLLERQSSDIDIVTSANPEEVESLFNTTHPIGKQFGVILVVEDNKSFEVTTFRKEHGYEDKRRPSKVSFTTAKNDALRRDFTINGMFYNPVNNKVIDYVGGQEDVKKKVIRFIGDPLQRIEEDHLRLVRAIRLRTTLGFQYDAKTFEAVRSLSQLIKGVSSERIRDELNKIMASHLRHQGLVELSESALLKHLIWEIDALKGIPQPIEYHHEGDVFTHTYLALKSLPADCPSHIAWAVMLHDIGKAKTLKNLNGKIVFHGHAAISSRMARSILERLRFSTYEINNICYLVENHMTIGDIAKMRPAKKYAFLLHPWMKDLIDVARADAAGTYPPNQELVKQIEGYLEEALAWKRQKEQCTDLKIFSGDDLIKLGFVPGEKFKEILETVQDEIVDGHIKTNSKARELVLERFKK